MKKLIIILLLFVSIAGFAQQNIIIGKGKLEGILYNTKSGVTDTIIALNKDSLGQFKFMNGSDPINPLDLVNYRTLLNVATGINIDSLLLDHSNYMKKAVYDTAEIGEQLVGINAAQTINNKTLILPVIANYTNATHNHTSNATGGTLSTDDIIQGITNLWSQWTQSGANIYRPSGNVGIGGNPTTKLDVFGTTRTQIIDITNSLVMDGLSLTDITPGTSNNNKLVTQGYVDDAVTASGGYNDEMAQDAVGSILDDGTLGDAILVYDDGTPKISATVKDDSHNHTSTTISGLTTSDFTSQDVSQWNNDANYVGSTFVLTSDLSGTLASPSVVNDSHTHTSATLPAETDPIFAGDSANLLHWIDTLHATKGIATAYDLSQKVSDTPYDATTWNGVTTIAPSKNAVRDKIESMSAVSYCPATMTVNRGTLNAGTAANLCAVGGTDVNISELNGTDPLRITFAWTGVERMNYFTFFGEYNGGSTHVQWVEIYNPNTTNWDFVGSFGISLTKQWYSFGIFQPNTYISGGNVQIRINHQGTGVATHFLILDYLDVNFGGAGGGTNVEASTVSFSASGNISSTNVQSAIQELDTEKAPVSGSANYIQNQNDSPQTADFNINGTGKIWKLSDDVYSGGAFFIDARSAIRIGNDRSFNIDMVYLDPTPIFINTLRITDHGLIRFPSLTGTENRLVMADADGDLFATVTDNSTVWNAAYYPGNANSTSFNWSSNINNSLQYNLNGTNINTAGTLTNVAYKGTLTNGFIPYYQSASTALQNSNINYNGTNIGIGTSSQNYLVDIQKSLTGAVTYPLNVWNNFSAANSEVGVWFAPTTSPATRGAAITAINNGSDNISLKFLTGTGATITEKVRFAFNGNVGINTAGVDPIYRLEVRETLSLTNGSHPISLLATPASTAGIQIGYFANGTILTGGYLRSIGNLPLILGTTGNNQAVSIADGGNTVISGILTHTQGTLAIHSALIGDLSSGAWVGKFSSLNGTNLTDGFVPYHVNDATGEANSNIFHNTTSVGINTTTPDAATRLDVNGKIKTTDIQITTGAQANYVWTSTNTTGNATWQPNTAINSYKLLTGNVSGRNINVNLAGFAPANNSILYFVPDADIATGDTITLSVNSGAQYKIFNKLSCVDTLAMQVMFENNQWYLITSTGSESVSTNTNTGDQNISLDSTATKYLIGLTNSDTIEIPKAIPDTLFTTVAISDETTALTTGTAKRTFRMPVGCTLTKVRANVVTAPTGANLIFDIKENGSTILSTLLSIDATEKTSKTAASAAVISDSAIADDSEMTIDITQIGSTVAGAGAKIILYYVKN